MLQGLLAAIVVLGAGPPTDLPDDSAPLVSIDMPPGGAPPDGCTGMMWVEVVGDGRYRLKVIERSKGEPVEAPGTLDRRQLLKALEPRRTDRSQCGRVIVSADEARPYSDVLSTISMLRHNGFDRISLIDPTPWNPN
jgi:biopolymer transport protein ExbD